MSNFDCYSDVPSPRKPRNPDQLNKLWWKVMERQFDPRTYLGKILITGRRMASKELKRMGRD